jgi:replicative DNA helicase
MAKPRRIERISVARLIQRMDTHASEEPPEDTVPTGFQSVDRVLGGGIRRPEETRAAVGSVALKLQALPLHIHPIVGRQFDEALASAWKHKPKLIVVDYLQLLPAPSDKLTQEEDNAAALRALKALALERDVACLLVAQLPLHQPGRPDPRPTLDDFGTLGAVKQHADIVLGLFREEMYNPGGGVDGAAELIVAKNRNGPTGFIDLYFYHKWMRFEDMLDPDR